MAAAADDDEFHPRPGEHADPNVGPALCRPRQQNSAYIRSARGTYNGFSRMQFR
jgi:hypothetical protein